MALLLFFLGVDHMAIAKIVKNGLPQKLQNFLEPEEKLEMFSVKVLAKCAYKDRTIHFYPVSSIELLLRAYSKALIAGILHKNQQHIGKKSIQVQTTLIRSVLASLICEACELNPRLNKSSKTPSEKTSSRKKGNFSSMPYESKTPIWMTDNNKP
ncbi:MAG: hypothetical protein HUU50_18425 [Candidatus Brocadiae bacterium]|nr:hypothetical protein [Candidatus Brocadiia bacterium]